MTGLPRGPNGLRHGLMIPIRRRVFFSFHYERDNWSVSQVRNSWLANPVHSAQPFYDHARWEEVKRQGDAAIKRWIDNALTGASVTVVLIGPETLNRRWVRYEIDESLRRNKGLIGVTLEGIRQRDGLPDNWNQYATYGPFDARHQTHPVYSWLAHDGRSNLSNWVSQAARDAGRR